MGYNNDCIVKIDQEFFQPCDRIQIQVVCRLIQKKNIRITEQCLCQQYLYLQGRCQLAHLLIMQLGVNSKTVQKGRSIGLRFPAVHIGELAFQLCGLYAVFIRKVFLGINGILFLHDLIQSLISHDNCIQNRICIILEMILLQYRQSLTRIHDNFTLGRFQFSG